MKRGQQQLGPAPNESSRSKNNGVYEEPTSATQQLIDIQDKVDEIDRRLAAQKQDFRIKMHLMLKKREDIDKQELHLKTSLMNMEKYFKDNELRKTRADKKAEEAHEMARIKDKELERLRAELKVLEGRKRKLAGQLVKHRICQTFLTQVLDSAVSADFHEIRGIIFRFDTLMSTYQDLMEKQQKGEDSIKELRKNLVEYTEEHGNELIQYSMTLAELQGRFDRVQQRVVELESKLSKTRVEFSDKTMILGKIIITTNNLYETVITSRKNITILPEEIVSEPALQLLTIQEYFNDLKDLTQDVASTTQSLLSKRHHVTIASTDTIDSTPT